MTFIERKKIFCKVYIMLPPDYTLIAIPLTRCVCVCGGGGGGGGVGGGEEFQRQYQKNYFRVFSHEVFVIFGTK